MVNVIEGSIFNADEEYICHQINCVTNKAKHLAYEMFKQFPHADVYSNREGRDELGEIIVSGNGIRERYVIGILGQRYPGVSKYDNDRYELREKAFKNALDRISAIENLNTIAFPWGIGCGAAGGDWERYFTMILEFSNKHPYPVVTIYKLPTNEK